MNRLTNLFTTTMLSLLLAVGSASAAQINARVIDVKDGDTIKVRDENGVSYYVRLTGVDAPELKQLHGHAAREHLLREIAGRDVDVVFNSIDVNGRLLAKVYLYGEDMNRKLLESGLAWHDVANVRNISGKEYKKYAAAEVKARKQGKGLWHDDMAAVAPWRYREISSY